MECITFNTCGGGGGSGGTGGAWVTAVAFTSCTC